MIYLFIGKSGSGKDYMLKQMLKNKPNVKPMVSVTTRPPRVGEENGVDYHFVSDEIFDHMLERNAFVEHREYDTEFGIWKYATLRKPNATVEDYAGIVDVQGAMDIINSYAPSVKVQVFYVFAPDDVRLERAKERGSFDLGEWNRRFEKDKVDFSDDKLEELNDLILDKYGEYLFMLPNMSNN
jgi:guanylate kinase